MELLKLNICCFLVISLLWGSNPIAADQKLDALRFENEMLSFRLRPNTPDQMAAFYEARGFPKVAVDAIKNLCFITAIMRNNSNKVVWLELSNWNFSSAQGAVTRLNKAYWKQQWQALDLPQANRSTFGWTLLPEVRDLHPKEPVGGNVVFPQITGPFTIEARFAIGRKREGDDLTVQFDNVRCATSDQ